MNTIKTLFPTLVIAFLLHTSGLYAEESIAHCSEIKQDSARLQCFDQQNADKEKPSKANLPIEWDRVLQTKTSASGSLLDERWELDSDFGEFIIRPYKPVYFFPVYYLSSVNRLPQTDNPLTTVSDELNLDHAEAKFQLSFKTKLANDILGGNADLWMGYTQTSRWQIYNSKESRPFRETNHEPEFMLAWRMNYELLGYRARLFSLSLNHQSNGQDEPFSRSWNRLILTLGFEKPDWVFLVRPWWRIPETSDAEDENPNIENYVGHGEILIVHRRENSHQISTQIRHSLESGEESRGSIQLNWSYPCFDRLRCHAQIFHGYGESLIDFNHKTTAVGLGVALLEWY